MDTSTPLSPSKRQVRPSVKLGSDNGGQHQLASHRAAIQNAREKEAEKTNPEVTTSIDVPVPAPVPCGDDPDHALDSVGTPKPVRTGSRKRKAIILSDDDNDSDEDAEKTPSLSSPKTKKKKKKKVAKKKKVSDKAGDASIQSIDIEDSGPSDILNKTDPTADLTHFYRDAPPKKGSTKIRAECIVCHEDFCNAHSTKCRHLESKHVGIYRKWAKQNNFESRLPSDTQQQRESVADELVQTAVNDHFKTATPEDKPPPYSDELFKQAALEWLLETNQPIQAFDHPKFQRMIDIASRATRGVKLPSRKQTRKEIICQFKMQMTALKECLNSRLVGGEISLTCDSWTAGNGDGFFAVTGHWIKEVSPTEWVEREALFGFTPMNTSHSGTHLGQALYKICNRLAIVHKIGHITCDNASNNDTMFDEFTHCYCFKTGKIFDIAKRHIRYDDSHVPDLKAPDQDEVGLVRAITVKARSSSQRKELFKNVQIQNKVPPRQLLLDMKVVDQFVFELSMKETNAEKRRKIGDLTLSEDEWTHVRLFNNLLEHADSAQHAFSAATCPTLHNALPAIEKLYSEWEKASNKPRYALFKDTLKAAMEKVNEYYVKTSASDAHIICMALNPSQKFEHFKKHWGKELLNNVKETVRKKFIERYEQLHKASASKIPTKTTKKVSSRRNCDDTESESESDEESDPAKP
ncbi:hypothetical protein CVT26_007781 [Gymnopilus dilepis]|uniref:hAT-like transposase RNase-H fold domain-containing protein n=1 Tax=Gymnopilus dilepis TaxID=231916 RepID=A0A409WTB6_9AGAR|nr:hypothetical protein CVT26_007781 [Gymnopilus dilepis]